MPPASPLPIHPSFSSVEEYISSLIEYSKDPLIEALCGGVHILDFFIRDPPTDLYSRVLPEEWRRYFDKLDIGAILDVLMRDELSQHSNDCPESLRQFIYNVRRHSVVRDFEERDVLVKEKHLKNYLAGMKPKKIHEVVNFSSFVSSLSDDIKETFDVPITHLVDFGSGLGYLPRALASKYYGHNVVGIESGADRIEAAKTIDAKLEKQLEKEAKRGAPKKDAPPSKEPGKVQHVLKRISDGDLNDIVEAIQKEDQQYVETPPNLMIISLHSCGNLIHHALNSLFLTPSVKAVAIIGCCYNLMTEKRGATFKPPFRDTISDRLIACSAAGDPHGFPMSKRLEEEDVTLNITARMMACQAPYNWTEETSGDFFNRHHYRALLQRLLMDKGFIQKPGVGEVGTQPLIIGSLRKASYVSFQSYVQAASLKVAESIGREVIISEDEAQEYNTRFQRRKKELCVLWSLMAFAASVVESVILVDRYLFLKERLGEDGAVWIETVFEYQESPRNCVIVAVKKDV